MTTRVRNTLYVTTAPSTQHRGEVQPWPRCITAFHGNIGTYRLCYFKRVSEEMRRLKRITFIRKNIMFQLIKPIQRIYVMAR